MEQIDFLATDEIKLTGILRTGKIKTDKVILSIHGMTSNCLKTREEIIAKNVNEKNIDYFGFNNRGTELVTYIRRNINGKKEKFLGGTTYEDVLESNKDLVGAILKLKELGYKNIYLQGHSLGCTKIVYTYNKLKDEGKKEILELIKGIILLSLIDIPMAVKVYTRDKYEEYIKFAEEKLKTNELMPKESFIHPISAKTFLRYARDNEEIDFAGYGRDSKLEKLNNIEVPLFMRWGNDKEMIIQNAVDLAKMVNEIITNHKKDISYIDGANHSYDGKEEILAKEILEFIEKYK